VAEWCYNTETVGLVSLATTHIHVASILYWTQQHHAHLLIYIIDVIANVQVGQRGRRMMSSTLVLQVQRKLVVTKT
jgi:hypothetical protein